MRIKQGIYLTSVNIWILFAAIITESIKSKQAKARVKYGEFKMSEKRIKLWTRIDVK